MPRVSCEGKDGALTRSDLPGKLLPVCLALIQVEEGARLEFPGDIIRPTLSPQFWSALWSGFLSSPRFYRSWHQKHKSYISDTPQGSGPERERHLPTHSSGVSAHSDLGQGSPHLPVCHPGPSRLPELLFSHVVDVQRLFTLRQDTQFHLTPRLALPSLLFCLRVGRGHHEVGGGSPAPPPQTPAASPGTPDLRPQQAELTLTR